MTVYTGTCSRSIVTATTGALIEIFRHWIGNQQLKFRLYRERQQLRQMSDSMLQDIGISRTEAIAEANRSDIPTQRLMHLG